MKPRLRKEFRWYHMMLVGAVSMLVAFLGIGVLIPPRFSVQRTTTVLAPPAVVFALLSDVRSHRLWAPWCLQDPSVRLVFGAAVEGIGARYEWSGEQVGTGTWLTANLRPSEALAYELSLDGRPGLGGLWELRQFGQTTRVTWEIHGDAGWNLAARYVQLAADPMFGAVLELGLQSLGTAAESARRAQPATP